MDSWSKTSKFPCNSLFSFLAGHFVRTLGDVGDKATETEVLLLEHDVPFTPFSRQVLSCLPSEGDEWVVKDDVHLVGRIDFRELDVCSIDPPGKLLLMVRMY